MISRVYEDMEDIKGRFNEKSSELNDYNVLTNEYENSMENLSKIIQVIQTKTRQTNAKLNLDLLKDLTVDMQTYRSLLDRLQILSSTLTSQLTDSNERDRVRCRLNEITRRWTELEQDLISEEEDMTEMNHVHQQYTTIKSTCDHWLNQLKDLINELKNAKTAEIFDQIIPKAKSILSEYQSHFEHLQRLRNRLNRLIQTNRTPEATQKVNY
jgi:chromosome segregation ATPase